MGYIGRRKVAYVILAAGSARRMGFAKVTTPLAGRSPIERLHAAVAGRDVCVVTTATQYDACERLLPNVRILLNSAPERGMTSSLFIAHEAIDPKATLGVLLADKPFVSAGTLDRCERALHAEPACEVLFAAHDGEPGHPVYLAPAARALLAGLPGGDTLRSVRDDPRLRRIALACDEDDGVLIDLDTAAAWHAAERRLHA